MSGVIDTSATTMPQANVSDRKAVYKSLEKKDFLVGYAFLAPAILMLGFVLLIPFVQAVILSFYNKPIGAPATFAGVENYVATLTDPAFWTAAKNTFVFVFFSITLKVLIGMGV